MWTDHRKYLLLCLCIFVPLLLSSADRVDRVVVDKSEKKLYLMHSEEVVHSFHVVFGADPKGHKQHEGDERTPEGNYTLDYKNSHSKFHRSIHISYPNAKDRRRAKEKGLRPGGAIFIHGQMNGLEWLSFASQYFNWTDGCIALKNSDMDEVWKSVKPGTPIEIKP